MMCTKMAFASRAAARSYIRLVKVSKTARQPMTARAAYECRRCGQWHTTSLSRAEQRRKGLA